jgi:hypothetical protein
MAYEKPTYGQLRTINELRKHGVLVSAGAKELFGEDIILKPLISDLKSLRKKHQGIDSLYQR